MDTLIRHCLRELAFEGDLGCTVHRLRGFIHGFWENAEFSAAQNLDDRYLSLVWNLLACQPGVKVGVVSDGAIDVAIAPQRSTKREASNFSDGKSRKKSSNAREIEASMVDDESSASLLPIPMTTSQSLSELLHLYGDVLRIAVSRDSAFFTVTGLHTRQSKLTPMVYTCLQFVTRAREHGITVVELGAKTGYDQKTCFYLVKQLLALDLVVKLRRPGVGSHFVLHKHFYRHGKIWQQIQDESRSGNVGECQPVESSHSSKNTYTDDALMFDRIDSRHLSSLSLVRSRVLKLLEKSTTGGYPLREILTAIGFERPTKTDRRFFLSRMNELFREGSVEKVKNEDMGLSDAQPIYIRIPYSKSKSIVPQQENDLLTTSTIRAPWEHLDSTKSNLLKFNTTVPKLIIDTICNAGLKGVTIHEICEPMGDFDRRTAETLVSRMERIPPPRHLSDLAICDIMESHGREHRHRYFSLKAYRALLEKELLQTQDQRYASINTEHAGSFAQDLRSTLFYSTSTELHSCQDDFRAFSRGSLHLSLKRKHLESPDNSQDVVKKPRGRPPKRQKIAVEADATSTGLAGNGSGAPAAIDFSVILTSVNHDDDVANVPSKKKRGRPLKRPKVGTESSLKPPDDFASLSKTDVAAIFSENNTEPNNSGPSHLHSSKSVSMNESIVTPDTVADHNSYDHADQRTSNTLLIERTFEHEVSNQTTLPAIKRVGRRELNLSHLRRRNEFMTLLASNHGVMEASARVFRAAHLELLDKLSQDGESTSAPPGTTLDSRTIRSTFHQLENEGKVKIMYASLPDQLGVERSVPIVHDSSLSPSLLNAYLGDLSCRFSQRERHPNKPSDILSASQSNRDSSHPIQDTRSLSSINPTVTGTHNSELPAIRETLLKERQTVSQLYGATVGRIHRARQLHLCTLDEFIQPQPSAWVVSSTESLRIVHVSFYWTDVPLSVYCQLVPVSHHIPDLDLQFQSIHALSQPVKSLPTNLHSELQVGLIRCRQRIREHLETLVALRLVVPLAVSREERPTYKLVAAGSHPTGFEPITLEDSSTFPLYWKFNEVACLYRSPESNDTPVTFPILTSKDAESFWDKTAHLVLDDTLGYGAILEAECPMRIAATLQRPLSWASSYIFSWRQGQYLRSQATSSSETSPNGPLVDQSSLDQISWAVCAPKEEVKKYYELLSLRRQAAKARKERRKHPISGVRDIPLGSHSEDMAKRRLATKAADAKSRRQRKWDSLVADVHPGPMDNLSTSRLLPLRDRFLDNASGNNTGKWLIEIRKALSRDDSAPVTFATRSTRKEAPAAVTSTYLSNATHRSVRDIVEELSGQYSRLLSESNRSEGQKARRQRFQWNHELDELARDVSVILRSRCRSQTRMDWSAAEQAFPNIPRNSIRQHINNLRQEPGVESYLKRLEDKWHQVWLEYRGSPWLPDSDPESLTEFDLVSHVEFLRKYLDKSSLEVNIVKPAEEEFLLPVDTSSLSQRYSLPSLSAVSNTWESLYWTWGSDETKEKTLINQAFVVFQRKEVDTDISPTRMQVARSTLKMVLSTPDSQYDELQASAFLRKLGEEAVAQATADLLNLGVVSKVTYDPAKSRPGKMLRISDININALDGPFTKEVFHEACSVKEDITTVLQRWSPLSSDGETAALLHLISANQVQFDVDVGDSSLARAELDWNSKKVDDDLLEATIRVALRECPQQQQGSSRLLRVASEFESCSTSLEPDTVEGHIHDGVMYFCAFKVAGLANCPGCVDIGLESLGDSLKIEERRLLRAVYDIIESAGARGLTMSELLDDPKRSTLWSQNQGLLVHLAALLLQTQPPIIFSVGYDQSTLVAASQIMDWAVVVGGEEMESRLVLPRRWINIHGDVITELWNSACRAIAANVLVRPGITIANLCHRLRLLYDRPEIIEIVHFLAGEDIIRAEYSKTDTAIPDEFTADESVFLLLGNTDPWVLS